MEEKETQIKKKSIGKNYIYNLLYQIFLIIVPLITTPYVSRVLGNDGNGKYSFCISIVSYFTLFASLGFTMYGQREISKLQNNKREQTKVFWEIFVARLIPFSISLLVYLLLLFINIYDVQHTQLMYVLIIQLVAVAFDIVFFFQGNEEFGKIVVRNFIIKLLSIICIFVFVKNRDDLVIYVLIQALSIIVANVSLWAYLPKMIQGIKVKELKPLKHMIPTITLFIPTIAISIYTVLDKTLIGILIPGTVEIDGVIKNVSDIENGNYEYAERLVKMLLTVTTALGVVMIPRNSKLFSEGNIDAIKSNIIKTMKYVCFIGCPIMFGIIAASSNLLPWFLGPGYDRAINLMKILSPIIIIIGFSNIFGLQYLVPSGQDKKFTIAITSGAFVNLVLNIILIPFLYSYGAAIATVIAESFVTVIMYIFIKKDIKLLDIFKSVYKYFISSLIMFVPCMVISSYLSPSFINTFIIAIVGVVIYGVLMIIVKDEFVYMGLEVIKNKVKKLKK